MAGKAFRPYFFVILIRTSMLASGGCIANWTTLASASQRASGKPSTNCPRRSMRLMNVHYKTSLAQTGNLPDGSFNALSWFRVRSELRNLQIFSHLISRPDRFRNTTEIGASKTQLKRCFPRAQLYSPLSTSTVTRSYSFPTSLSRNS